MGNASQRGDFARIDLLSEIDEVRSINGIAIDELNRRGKPLADKTQDASGWRYRCSGGFIGADEDLADVLRRDWLAVARLGTTHGRLAAALRAVVREAEAVRQRQALGPMAAVTVSRSRIMDSVDMPCKLNSELLVAHHIFNGCQHSMFFNEDREDSSLNYVWFDEYVITDVATNLEVRVAGNDKAGIIDYIDRFGFYEGGHPDNDYRIEPAILLGVLTGHYTKQAHDVVMFKHQAAANRLLTDIADLSKLLERTADAAERQVIQDHVDHLRRVAASQQARNQALLEAIAREM